jgi:hypothetical protein
MTRTLAFPDEQGKKIPLSEIILKRITYVNISFSPKKVPRGKRHPLRHKRFVVEDTHGIDLLYHPGNPMAQIQFAKKHHFDAVQDFARGELVKKIVKDSLERNYQITFPVIHLREIKWVEE